MTHGVHPVRRKKTHYSTRTFGASTVSYAPFSLDFSGVFPDQNADGWPEECTIYAQTELCQDQDKKLYDRVWVRRNTDLISGQEAGPYDIEASLKAVCVYGPAEGARNRGRYFMLEKQPGLDWYDSAIAVMQKTGCPLSVASPWFLEFEEAPGGRMPDLFPQVWQSGVPGHNHVVYGLTSDGLLIDKSWNGPSWGDAGKAYWSRAAFNRLMDIPGAGAFLVAPWDGSVLTIQWSLIYRLQILISYYTRLAVGSWSGAR